ncbi:MAG: tetratricopeptide repeat protein, partial [Cyanobacteria bacterium]|nr:tetratricopeptide repeat protein [Cyanobacteria bacterium CG_2015-09_32_10]
MVASKVNEVYRVLECRPDSYQGWYYQANQLRHRNLCQDALYSYEKAIEYHPNDYFAWYYKGKVLEELEKYLEAIYSFSVACKI